MVKKVREQGQSERIEFEKKIDDLKNELAVRDDQIRRLEFEIEK